MAWIVLAVAAAVVAIAVRQAESVLHVWPGRRAVVRPEAARELAAEFGARWETAETKARDGLMLRAWLFVPARWNGAAAIALHGFTDSRMGMLPHARLLMKNGIAALVPDSRGHGASDGNLVTFGLREAGDVSMWCDFLERRLGVRRLFAIGNSMGAGVLLRALPEEARIVAAIAECGLTTFAKVALDRLAGRLGLPAFAARTLLLPIAPVAFLYGRLRYGVAMWRVRPIEQLRRASVPVLLIHGTADQSIAPRHSRELHAANPAHTELWEVAGARHAEAALTAPEEYEGRMVRWFEAVGSGDKAAEASRARS